MAAKQIFLAGAAGAIGSRLVPLLLSAGHDVTGTTRSAAKVAQLRELGARPVVVDVFDYAALREAIGAAHPEIVIHQLTDLPKDLDPAHMGAAIARNARIRTEGTRNLVAAAVAAGARRLIAQSIAWAYAPGNEPHSESDPLDVAAQGDRGVTVRGVVDLEERALQSPPLAGVVLRYGQLYGPGTHADAAVEPRAAARGCRGVCRAAGRRARRRNVQHRASQTRTLRPRRRAASWTGGPSFAWRPEPPASHRPSRLPVRGLAILRASRCSRGESHATLGPHRGDAVPRRIDRRAGRPRAARGTRWGVFSHGDATDRGR